EQVGPLPGGGEGADAAGADAADGPPGRVGAEAVVLADLRQDLLLEEAGVLVGQGVVLEGAVLPRPLPRPGRRHDARVDEEADGVVVGGAGGGGGGQKEEQGGERSAHGGVSWRDDGGQRQRSGPAPRRQRRGAGRPVLPLLGGRRRPMMVAYGAPVAQGIEH